MLGISLAVAGRLHPAVAAGAMVASSLMVVIQSVRLSNLEFAEWNSEDALPENEVVQPQFRTDEKTQLLESSSAA